MNRRTALVFGPVLAFSRACIPGGPPLSTGKRRKIAGVMGIGGADWLVR